jgi:aminoglycoside phosphotransferase (APT) family kinase protein
MDSVKRLARGSTRDAGFNRGPILEGAFEWLAEHAPAESRLPHSYHATTASGTCSWKTARKSAAILDWVLAYIGDPRFDLGYMATAYMGWQAPAPQ